MGGKWHARLMDPRLTLLTVGVRDVAAARRFYVDGLGWTPTFDLPEQSVLFLQVAPGLLLSFFDAGLLAQDMDLPPDAVPTAQGIALAHNVASEAEVDAVITQAVAAGATLLKAPRRAEWGGYSGYVEDPCGVRWEIAHNPGLTVDADGTVRMVPIE